MRTVAAVSLMVVGAAGHGALIYPPSRNAVDRFLPEFEGGRSPVGGGSCNCGDDKGGCNAGVRASGGGQPCLWFSQGCTIGCSNCTGIGSHSSVSLCANPKNGGKATLPKSACAWMSTAHPAIVLFFCLLTCTTGAVAPLGGGGLLTRDNEPWRRRGFRE
jgi:hypothetical protein